MSIPQGAGVGGSTAGSSGGSLTFKPGWGWVDDVGNVIVPQIQIGDLAPPAPSSSIGFTGSSGGGGDPMKSSTFDHFAFWLGSNWANTNVATVQRAYDERWSAESIQRWVFTSGLVGPGVDALWAWTRQEMSKVGWRPDASTVAAICADGTYNSPGWSAYLYNQAGIDWNPVTNPSIAWAQQMWLQYVGPDKPMTWKATQELQSIVRQYGNGVEAQTVFNNFLKGTQSASAGRYGQTLEQNVKALFESWFGRPPTAEELLEYKPYAEDVNALKNILRRHPEYSLNFGGKPANWAEEAYLDYASSINLAFAERYGYAVTPGAADYIGQDTSPRANGRWEFVTPEELAECVRLNITADDIVQETAWLNDVDYLEGTINPIMEETMGYAFSRDELYTMASGALGAGKLRAIAVEAQNRANYAEAYWRVFGTYPSPDDYERISSEFVSPSALIMEYQARASAAEMYPEVSDLLQRVYGMSVTEDDLKDMALGRAGTGDLRALINEAQKLDSYRWIHKQYYGAEPTPADYAKYAGYAGPDELQWEIVTQERIGEYSDVIKEDFKIGLGLDIADDDIFTMLGEQEGYGELRAEWTKAKKKRKDVEEGEKGAHRGEKVNIAYQEDPLGGFRTALPGLANL